MRLFIGEKPDLAKVIVDGLGGTHSANRRPDSKGRRGHSKTKAHT